MSPKPELRYAVHGITDPDGVAHVFVPGDDVPEWAVPQITNPNCWVDGVLPGSPEAKPATKARTAKSEQSE